MSQHNNKLVFFLTLLQGLVISNANGQSVGINSSPVDLTTISNICLTSPFSCLQHVDEALLAAPKNSRVYFEILQYKMATQA